MGFVSLDVNAAVGIPEADGAVFAAAQAVIAVGVKPSGEDSPLVTPEHVSLIPGKFTATHLFLSFPSFLPPRAATKAAGKLTPSLRAGFSRAVEASNGEIPRQYGIRLTIKTFLYIQST